MGGIEMILQDYIKSELLVLIPVLYVFARMMHNSKIKEQHLPFVLLGISIILSAIYTFSTSQTETFREILMALFVSIVQGVLLSGTSVYGGILYKIMAQKKSD